MGSFDAINARIRDRATIDWLTPSQKAVWNFINEFDSAPHRVINIYGNEGTGKTFVGWMMDREHYATYLRWHDIPKPQFPRLVIDDAKHDRVSTREIRPMVDTLGIKQIILLTRVRIDEPSVPAVELRVLNDDIESVKANLYRHMRIIVQEGTFQNYKSLLSLISEVGNNDGH